jgi:arylsulfatase A-like enzyme
VNSFEPTFGLKMTKHPNVLMLAIDCLRSDRVFGQGRTCKTPNIDKLTAKGTAFSNIFVENSMTAPSFTSIFTGRYAGNHGIVGMIGVRLDDGIPTMAEIFTANGYETYGEATGPLNPILGIDRGFVHYNFRRQHEYFFGEWGNRLLTRFANREFVEPFFVMVHFWEAHVPFQVQGKFDSPEFGATAYDRAISGLDAFIGEILARVPDDTLVILTGDHGECVGEVPPPDSLLPYFLAKLRLPPINKARKHESIDNAIDLIAEEPRLHEFATEVNHFSRAGQKKIGLTPRLKLLLSLMHIGAKRYTIQVRRGLKKGFFFNLKQKFNDHMLLSAVAHGNIEGAQIQLVRNSLAEHSLHHGYHVYDYLQNVPLILSLPGLFPGGRRITSELRHIDLLPTLIDALKLEYSADTAFDGSSFYNYVRDGVGADRPVYLEARGGAQAERVFLIRGIRRSGRGIAFAPFEDGRAPIEFFGPAHPAAEPIMASAGDDASALMEEANHIAAAFSPGAGRKLNTTQNAEMCEQLKNLGYM